MLRFLPRLCVGQVLSSERKRTQAAAAPWNKRIKELWNDFQEQLETRMAAGVLVDTLDVLSETQKKRKITDINPNDIITE